jgi:hypothetical protein
MGKYEEILSRSNARRKEEEEKKIQEEHKEKIKKLMFAKKAKEKLADILSDANNIKDLEIRYDSTYSNGFRANIFIIFYDRNISDDVYYIDGLFKNMEDEDDLRAYTLNDEHDRTIVTIGMVKPFLNEIKCVFHRANRTDSIDDLMEKLIEELRK